MLFAFATLVAVGSLLGPPPVGRYTDIRSAPFHPSIHNMGNVGILGRLHARFARVATRVIDDRAYGGRDMRAEMAEHLRARHPNGTSVLDVGCGTGTLTEALERTGHFEVTAIDSSEEMVRVARAHVASPVHCINGVDATREVKVAIVSMVMHELPALAHRQLLAALFRIAGEVWIVDIDLAYSPSSTFLSGEPYALDFLAGWNATMHDEAHRAGRQLEVLRVIPEHVTAWIMSDAGGCSSSQEQRPIDQI